MRISNARFDCGCRPVGDAGCASSAAPQASGRPSSARVLPRPVRRAAPAGTQAGAAVRGGAGGAAAAMGAFRRMLEALGLRKKKRSVIVLGLPNAGKTSVVAALDPERLEANAEVTPTVGFSVDKFSVGRLRLTVIDLSGQEKYLKLWECYYADAAAVIYVIDSADAPRLPAAKSVLDVLMSHKHLEGKPLLLLANKQDLVHATPASQVVQLLELHKSAHHCSHLACASSAATGEGLAGGFGWLTEMLGGGKRKLKQPRVGGIR